MLQVQAHTWALTLAIIGVPGLIWAGYHFGHVWGHLFHTFFAQAVAWLLFAGLSVMLIAPIWDGRTNLYEGEVLAIFWAGAFGAAFLLYELGHLLHGGLGRIVNVVLGVGTLLLLVFLWFTQPVGIPVKVVNTQNVAAGPATPASAPVGSPPATVPVFPTSPATPAAPTMVAPAQALPADTKVGPAGYSPVPCSQLPYYMQRERGC